MQSLFFSNKAGGTDQQRTGEPIFEGVCEVLKKAKSPLPTFKADQAKRQEECQEMARKCELQRRQIIQMSKTVEDVIAFAQTICERLDARTPDSQLAKDIREQVRCVRQVLKSLNIPSERSPSRNSANNDHMVDGILELRAGVLAEPLKDLVDGYDMLVAEICEVYTGGYGQAFELPWLCS